MSRPARKSPPESLVRPKLGDSLLGATSETAWFGVAFLGGLVGVFVLMLLGGGGGEDAGNTWIGILGGPAMLGCAWACYVGVEALLARNGEASYELVAKDARKPVLASLGVAVAAIAVALAGSSLIGWLQSAVLGVEIEEQETIVSLVNRGDTLELVLLGITAVILAPFAEEMLFRDMFFRRLYHRAGLLPALLLPALAFALSHWNPVGLAVYAWLAVVFALSYLASGRIWVAILAHAGHNAVVLAILLFGPDSPLNPGT